MRDISVTNLAKLPEAVVIDVREPHEYAGGHVPGAINIPMSEFLQRQGDLPAASPLYIVCESGGRSAQATEYLHSVDIEAVNVLGGTSAWREAGLPTE